MKNLYYVEITDTFGGEANYSWVTRHVIRAKSERGAINALSRRSGINWRSVGCDRYDSMHGLKTGAIEFSPRLCEPAPMLDPAFVEEVAHDAN